MFDVDPANTMNPDKPSREEMEAKLTALLLGELSEEEARLLRWAISQDPALARLLEQLKRTIGIVREVSVKPAESDLAGTAPLKLSEERRKKLLAHFQTPRPKVKELSWLKRIEIRPLIPVLVILAVLGIIVVVSVPNFIKARSTSPANAIVNNLRQLDGAKQEWAMEHHAPADAVPTMGDLKDYLKGDAYKSIAGEKYEIGKVSEPVKADLDAKKAKQIGALPAGVASGDFRFSAVQSTTFSGPVTDHGETAGDVVQLSSDGKAKVLSEDERQKELVLNKLQAERRGLELQGGTAFTVNLDDTMAAGAALSSAPKLAVRARVSDSPLASLSDNRKHSDDELQFNPSPVAMMPPPPQNTEIVLPKAEETTTYYDGINTFSGYQNVSGSIALGNDQTLGIAPTLRLSPVVNQGAGYRDSVAFATPVTPSAPAKPNEAVGPGGVVESGWRGSGNGSWNTAGNWDQSGQTPDSAGNAIADNRRYANSVGNIQIPSGNIQNQVALNSAPIPAPPISGIANVVIPAPPISGIAPSSGAANLGGTSGVTVGGGRGAAGRGAARGGRGGGAGAGFGGGPGGAAGAGGAGGGGFGGGGGGGRGGGGGGGGGFGGGGNFGGGGFAGGGAASAGANAPQAKSAGDSGLTLGGMISGNGMVAVEGQAREVLKNREDQSGVAAPAWGVSMNDNAVVSDDFRPIPAGTIPGSAARISDSPISQDEMRVAINEGAIVQNQSADRSTYYRMLDNGADAGRAPVLGDMPLEGQLFASQDKAPASTTATAPAGSLARHYAAKGIDSDVYLNDFAQDESKLADHTLSAGLTESLTKSGSGTMALSGNNTWSGTTTVNAGKLALGNSEYAGTSSLNMNGGSLALNGENKTYSVGTVVTSGGLVLPDTGTVKGLESDRDQSTYVATLKNADPNEVARVMQNMFGSSNARSGTTSALQQRSQNAVSSMGSVGISTGIASTGGGGSGGGGGGGNGALGVAQIWADPDTHNLVVVADKETEKQIQGVLAGIDGQDVKLTRDSGDVAVLAVGTSLTTANLAGNRTVGNIAFTNANSFMIADTGIPLTMDFTNHGATIVVAAGTNAIGPAVALNDNVNVISRKSAASSPNDLTLNFQRAPLDTVLNYLSDSAGLIIVEDAQPRNAYVTITGNHLTQDEVLTQLNSQLDRSGYAAIRNGRTLTIDSKKAADVPLQKAPEPLPIPQPEILTSTNAFSTFSMNVSDVSYKLAEASLQKGRMPDAASIRSEEFINAFDYRDPEASAGRPVAFVSERARYPFAQNRDLLRFSIKTAASGRAANRPLNLVLLLDTSGSMERADRVAIIREALRVLSAKLRPQDTVSVVTFSRVARLWADGVPGSQAGEVLDRVGGITPEGGTNLEEAMNLAYQTALRHYLANGANRVVLLTDGAANLGNVNPGALKLKVESFRKQGIALDCFGIGWEDYDDSMLAELSGNGDGRYAFINTPEEASTEFAAKLAGALQVAAQDVKVQVEFNPRRVTSWRQIGYAKHQLTKEQFRDNTVLAAEVAAQEAGNALYTVELKPDGIGPVATVYVRYKIPGTMHVEEHSWTVGYDGSVPALEQSSPAMRLAGTASAFSEWLAGSAFAQEVTTDELLRDLSGVPQVYGADARPKGLEWMIRQAKSLSGR